MPATEPHSGRLGTLSEIGRVVSSTLDLRELYDTIYVQITRVMDASQFFIALHQPNSSVIGVPYLREEGTLLLDQEFPYGGNTTSVIIEGGASLLYGTAEAYQQYEHEHGLTSHIVGDETSESGIFVPLNTGSRTIGALSIRTMSPHAYSADDVRTLTVIASQAAVAIENARLYKSSQDAIKQMQVLLHVAQTINASLDLPAVLDAILLSMREVMPYAFAAVMLPDHASGTLEIVGSIGPSAKLDTGGDSLLTIPFGEGVTGAVFDSGEPVIVPDVRTFPGFVDHEIPEVLSEMAVPLKRGQKVTGVLDIGREGVDAFSPDEVALLTLFASQAAIAIENARLFADQQKRAEELQAVQSIVRELTPLHDAADIASALRQELLHLIEYHACHLYLMDTESKILVPMNHPGTDVTPAGVPIARGFAGWIARTEKAGLVRSTLNDERTIEFTETTERDESMVGAPLVYEGRVRGVITLSRVGSDQFDENSVRLLEIIAAQVAIAFDRARLYDELRTEAITDPLVGLWNRRYLMERYREERARAARNDRPLAALMLDIDRFKGVNDTYGHDAGDIVLQELAHLVRGQLRAEDIVARYGGEEFCILLPATPEREAIPIAQRLRRATEEYRLPVTAGVQNVTLSVGLAMWSRHDVEEELFSRADLAMYQAKGSGGNGVCLARSDGFILVRENF